MGRIHVLFWLDTEDYVVPESDDAPMRLAEIFSFYGVQGTFKLVGEKVRVLERRGRTDVIDALRGQDIGYHTNFHSKPPTITQYVAEMDWDEGVAEFLRRETPGLHDIQRTFGMTPSCYGHGGGTWVPHAFPALQTWGIPCYVSGGSYVTLDGRPFHYCGILAFSALESAMSIEFDIDRPDAAKQLTAWFTTIYERLRHNGGGVISIGTHPLQWVTDEFWDGINFPRGRNPLREGWVRPSIKSPERIERGYHNFRTFLESILRLPDVEVSPAHQLIGLYPDRARGRAFPMTEVVNLARAMMEAITFHRIDGVDVSAAEAFRLIVATLVHYAVHKEPPHEISHRPVLGPVRHVMTDLYAETIPTTIFTEGLESAARYLEHHGRIPSEVWMGASRMSTEDFLATAASALVALADGKLIDEIQVRRGHLTCTQYAREEFARGNWGWICFPDGFTAERTFELAWLQTWTIKPAVME